MKQLILSDESVMTPLRQCNFDGITTGTGTGVNWGESTNYGIFHVDTDTYLSSINSENPSASSNQEIIPHSGYENDPGLIDYQCVGGELQYVSGCDKRLKIYEIDGNIHYNWKYIVNQGKFIKIC